MCINKLVDDDDDILPLDGSSSARLKLCCTAAPRLPILINLFIVFIHTSTTGGQLPPLPSGAHLVG